MPRKTSGRAIFLSAGALALLVGSATAQPARPSDVAGAKPFAGATLEDTVRGLRDRNVISADAQADIVRRVRGAALEASVSAIDDEGRIDDALVEQRVEAELASALDAARVPAGERDALRAATAGSVLPMARTEAVYGALKAEVMHEVQAGTITIEDASELLAGRLTAPGQFGQLLASRGVPQAARPRIESLMNAWVAVRPGAQ
jgi:hypothetical protein